MKIYNLDPHLPAGGVANERWWAVNEASMLACVMPDDVASPQEAEQILVEIAISSYELTTEELFGPGVTAPGASAVREITLRDFIDGMGSIRAHSAIMSLLEERFARPDSLDFRIAVRNLVILSEES